jgi:hypothetical protein
MLRYQAGVEDFSRPATILNGIPRLAGPGGYWTADSDSFGSSPCGAAATPQNFPG